MTRHTAAGAMLLLVAGVALAADHTMRVGDQETITLKENPSTGYVWRIDERMTENPGVLRVEDKGYSPPGGAPPLGAAGAHSWVVEALSTGHARIDFVYQRPWEPTPAERTSWSVDVR